MKQLKKLLPVMLLALLAINCQTEEPAFYEEDLQTQQTYATADQNEVFKMLSAQKKMSDKSGASPYVEFDTNRISLENITESDAKLMVVPANTIFKGQHSRILALEVNGTLKTVVFNMYPNLESPDSTAFNGEITLATLQGNLLKGFKVEEGLITVAYDLHGKAGGSQQSKFDNAECRQWCGHGSSDPVCICNTQHLDGVTVTGPSNQSITHIPIHGLYGGSGYVEGPSGGSTWGYGGAGGGGSNPSFEDAIEDPSCESFDYYKVGNTGVQVAGVNGVWDVVTKWGKCPGIGVAASYQTYYFHLPAYWNPNYAAERSADALAGAFFDLQKWFQKQPCSQINTGVLALKMDQFIKENFQEIGGQATRNAPLGWLGTPRQYKEDWSGTDDCY